MHRQPTYIKLVPPRIARLPAIQLFRRGFDSLDIARAKNVKEPIVLKWLDNARKAERLEREEHARWADQKVAS